MDLKSDISKGIIEKLEEIARNNKILLELYNDLLLEIGPPGNDTAKPGKKTKSKKKQ